MIDLLLALGHHVLVFGLAALIAAEAALLRPGLDASQLRLLGRLDTTYGIFAVLILIVGFIALPPAAQPGSGNRR